MELFTSNIKKILIFSYILRNGNPRKKLLIIQKIANLKSFLYRRKWNFEIQVQKIKKIPSTKTGLIFSYILGNEKL